MRTRAGALSLSFSQAHKSTFRMYWTRYGRDIERTVMCLKVSNTSPYPHLNKYKLSFPCDRGLTHTHTYSYTAATTPSILSSVKNSKFMANKWHFDSRFISLLRYAFLLCVRISVTQWFTVRSKLPTPPIISIFVVTAKHQRCDWKWMQNHFFLI